MNDLFNIKLPDATCNTCKFRARWAKGTSIFQYYHKRKSNRTDNGHLLINCKQQACMYYEKGEIDYV